MPNPVKKNKGKARRDARQAQRPGMFAQFRDERQQHKENAGPLRKAAGVIPALHTAYLLKKGLKPKD